MKKHTIAITVWLLIVVTGTITSCSKEHETVTPSDTGINRKTLLGEGKLSLNNDTHTVQSFDSVKNLGFGFRVLELQALGTDARCLIHLPEGEIPDESRKYPVSPNYDVTPGSVHAFIRFTDSENRQWTAQNGTLYFRCYGTLVRVELYNADVKESSSDVTQKTNLTIELR